MLKRRKQVAKQMLKRRKLDTEPVGKLETENGSHGSHDVLVSTVELQLADLSALTGLNGEARVDMDDLMNVADTEGRSPVELKQAEVGVVGRLPRLTQSKDDDQAQPDQKEHKKAEMQAQPDQKEHKKAEIIVETRTNFTARKSNQMSFCRGASIREVSAIGKWHRGVLLTCCGSEIHPITGQVLFYPSNFVRPVSLKDRSVCTGQVVEARSPGSTAALNTEKPLAARQLGGSVQANKPNFKKTLEQKHQTQAQRVVMGKHAFKAAKRTQLSFCEGDLIQEIDATGKWHLGVLLQCENGTHVITDQKLYYPSNYVKTLK